jgi:thioredoxin-like negative regulator of GroEL
VAEKYRGEVHVVKVNVDEYVGFATLRHQGNSDANSLQNGKEEKRLVGATSVDAITQMIDRSLSVISA